MVYFYLKIDEKILQYSPVWLNPIDFHHFCTLKLNLNKNYCQKCCQKSQAAYKFYNLVSYLIGFEIKFNQFSKNEPKMVDLRFFKP